MRVFIGAIKNGPTQISIPCEGAGRVEHDARLTYQSIDRDGISTVGHKNTSLLCGRTCTVPNSFESTPVSPAERPAKARRRRRCGKILDDEASDEASRA